MRTERGEDRTWSSRAFSSTTQQSPVCHSILHSMQYSRLQSPQLALRLVFCVVRAGGRAGSCFFLKMFTHEVYHLGGGGEIWGVIWGVKR